MHYLLFIVFRALSSPKIFGTFYGHIGKPEVNKYREENHEESQTRRKGNHWRKKRFIKRLKKL
jgi:hypothetical protein